MQRNLLAQLPYHRVLLDLAVSPLTTAAWQEILAAGPKGCTAMTVFYTGNAILRISKGQLAQEGGDNEIPLFLTPGLNANCLLPIEIPGKARISVRAEDQDANEGVLVINFFG